MVRTSASYSRGSGFDSRLTIQGFFPGFTLTIQINGKHLEIGHEPFVLYSSQLIVQNNPVGRRNNLAVEKL
jgi:hypothetical protein